MIARRETRPTAEQRRFIGLFLRGDADLAFLAVPVAFCRAPPPQVSLSGRTSSERRKVWRQCESRVHRSTRGPISPRRLASADARDAAGFLRRGFHRRLFRFLSSGLLRPPSPTPTLLLSPLPPPTFDEGRATRSFARHGSDSSRPIDRPTDRTTNQPFGIRSEILKLSVDLPSIAVDRLQPSPRPSFAARRDSVSHRIGPRQRAYERARARVLYRLRRDDRDPTERLPKEFKLTPAYRTG